MLSRIGRSLVKSSFTKHLLKRVAISSSICGKTITWLPKMRMSDDQTSNVFQKLSTQLEKEIKYEIENYVQLEDQQQFLKEAKFEEIESEDSNTVILKKNVNDKLVQVIYQARQPSLGTEEQEQMKAEKEEGDEDQLDEEDEYGRTDNYCDFSVAITDQNGKGILVEASSYESELSLYSICCSDDVPQILKLNRFERSFKNYPGPEFVTLDERLQNSLFQYLKTFGIDEQLGTYIECASLDKDQRLYTKWLKDLRGFLGGI